MNTLCVWSRRTVQSWHQPYGKGHCVFNLCIWALAAHHLSPPTQFIPSFSDCWPLFGEHTTQDVKKFWCRKKWQMEKNWNVARDLLACFITVRSQNWKNMSDKSGLHASRAWKDKLDPSSLAPSLLWWSSQSSHWFTLFSHGSWSLHLPQERKFVGGSSQISECMAKELGDRVKLESPVYRIDQTGDMVVVETVNKQTYMVRRSKKSPQSTWMLFGYCYILALWDRSILTTWPLVKQNQFYVPSTQHVVLLYAAIYWQDCTLLLCALIGLCVCVRARQAKYVIVATPPGLNLKMHFNPELPPLRNQLIHRVPMGSVIKCMVYYRDNFWRKKGKQEVDRKRSMTHTKITPLSSLPVAGGAVSRFLWQYGDRGGGGSDWFDSGWHQAWWDCTCHHGVNTH